MLEIIYRIYEVADEETVIQNIAKDEAFGLYSSISKSRNNELLMDCMLCDSRDHFKQVIKDTWGKNTAFKYSKKLSVGDLYCIIIGEHCYTTERYFNKIICTCDCCGTTIKTYYGKPICYDDYEIKRDFYNIKDYATKRFCSHRCKQIHKEDTLHNLKPRDKQEFFVTRDMFTEKVAGYIYKITKKETGEFYIGQTIYAPVFRWGQHLKTDRFPIKNITDYQFEVIEIVPEHENILDREKYYIQKYYNENPSKSLNIMCTHNI